TTPNTNTNADYADSTLSSVEWNIQGFSPVEGVPHTFFGTPRPTLLKRLGYYTSHSGKGHFGSSGTPGGDPRNLGFDVNIAGSSIGHPASYYGQQDRKSVV